MALICILIGLILERTLDSIREFRKFDWFNQYSQWMIKHLPGLIEQGASSIIILLLPLMIAMAIVQNTLDDIFFDLFSVVFGLAVFVYCLGPRDLNMEIDGFLDARENGDEEKAQQYASALIGKEASPAPDQQIADVMHAILHQSNDRIFAVIFWFVVLGPFGAILYRLTSYTMLFSVNKTLAAAAKKLQAILAWAPAHLVAMGYALTGNYEGATAGFRDKSKPDDLSLNNYNTLTRAGLGALKDCTPGEETACIRSTRGLVLRTLVVWLAIISILTLIGWMA
ncbi:MAG: regulatory signaling modulator protein AmpE [Gammaproteobacteria bacterium]|nr:regulatory signaling modulator protein AmpE [Gammaproteobacteria bacterium]